MAENITLVGSRRTLGLRDTLRYALSDLPWGSACCGPAGEITVKFTFWAFVIRLKSWNSEGRQTSITGSRVSNCVLGLKTIAPAYGFDVGNIGGSMFGILVPFFGFPALPLGWPVSVESGDSQPGCPSEINLDNVGVDVGHVVASEGKPVSILGWRKLSWLKRRSLVVIPASLAPPSVGRASQSVGCRGAQVGEVGFSGSVTTCPVMSSCLSSTSCVS